MHPRPSLIVVWLRQIRVNFLLLPVVLVALGAAAAWRAGSANPRLTLLTLAGVLLAHISVNLFNEHADHRSGIDWRTRKTPFSGGTGCLQRKHTHPMEVLGAALLTLLLAGAIGLYLAHRSTWSILWFAAIGGAAAILYTTHLARWCLGEVAAGVCLGSFVVLGTFCVLHRALTTPVLFVSITPGILTALLLFLNEFPDADADKVGGRRHLVILCGPHRAARLYVLGLALAYLGVVLPVAGRILPPGVLLALLTLPLAVKAGRLALRFPDDTDRLLPALGLNVAVVLATDALMALGMML